MADLIIVYWRDIPAQVIVRKGRQNAKRELPLRFTEAIDMAAMRSGAAETDAYLAEWRKADPVPAILLGQLAVDRRYQGRGCARSLMLFALRTALRLSDDIGCYGVTTHPLDEEVRTFYRGFGFQDLPFDPGRAMMIRIMDVRQNSPGRN